MFRKLMILSVIFSHWACQTKSEKSGVKKKKGPDTKFNMFGDLPDGVFVQTLMDDPGTCKKVIQTCSSSKDMIKKCLESNLWNEALAKFFQGQDRPVGDPPNVCRVYEEQGIAQENITNCNKFYALCNDEHILQKNITNPVIAAGGSHTCILLDNHQVTCFGHGTPGQLGLGDLHNRNTPGDPINLGNNPAGRPYSVFSH